MKLHIIIAICYVSKCNKDFDDKSQRRPPPSPSPFVMEIDKIL